MSNRVCEDKHFTIHARVKQKREKKSVAYKIFKCMPVLH